MIDTELELALARARVAAFLRERRRRTIAIAAWIAAAVAVALPHVPGYEKSACFKPELRLGSVVAVILGGATGFVTAAELAAAIAARGRGGTPLRHAREAARWVVLAVLTVFFDWGLGDGDAGKCLKVALFLSPAALIAMLAARAAGRRGGPSVIALLVFLGAAEYLTGTGLTLDASFYLTFLGPTAAVLVARRLLGLGSAELERLGFALYAPDDIAAVPAALTIGLALYAHWAEKSGNADAAAAHAVVRLFEEGGGWWWAWAIPTAAVIASLRHLARRLPTSRDRPEA